MTWTVYHRLIVKSRITSIVMRYYSERTMTMQLSMKCSVAVHCLIFIHQASGVAKVTSALLAQSTGVNPVVIRNILSALKKAGLITVARGTGGAALCRTPDQITLYQIYSALEPDGLSSLIGIHACGQRPCPVARNIQKVLEGPYRKIEASIRETMEGITLASMLDEFQRCLAEGSQPESNRGIAAPSLSSSSEESTSSAGKGAP